jgi:RNA recognition motif-containing protein
MYNNIYVKNFPREWKEDKLREIFGRYGEILSLYRVENEAGAFSFICFGKKENANDKTYGFEAA